MATASQRLTALETRCTAIEAKNKTQDTSIAAVQTKNTAQDAVDKQLQERDSDLLAVIAALESRVAVLESRPFPRPPA